VASGGVAGSLGEGHHVVLSREGVEADLGGARELLVVPQDNRILNVGCTLGLEGADEGMREPARVDARLHGLGVQGVKEGRGELQADVGEGEVHSLVFTGLLYRRDGEMERWRDGEMERYRERTTER